ncbi:hypothetical protein ACFXG4_42825 [Nocardia sp. NPDC059246]|uniref:hypothetical protein n=1 Tax=unclassified Nocardia TaxID=2637762 RepID=UPI0036B2037E
MTVDLQPIHMREQDRRQASSWPRYNYSVHKRREVRVSVSTARAIGHVRQLGSLDLHLLDTETSTTSLHIGAITLLDSAVPRPRPDTAAP